MLHRWRQHQRTRGFARSFTMLFYLVVWLQNRFRMTVLAQGLTRCIRPAPKLVRR